MRNKHAGFCYRCGKFVEVGEGHFEKVKRKGLSPPRWRVQHADCAIKYRGTRHEHAGQTTL